MWIVVRSMDGKTSHRIDGLSKLTSIEDLRKKIKEKFNAPAERQRLFHRGKQLEDGHTLFDYDVGLNDIVQIMIRPVLTETSSNTSSSSSSSSSSSPTNALSDDEGILSDKENTNSSRNKTCQDVPVSSCDAAHKKSVPHSKYFRVGDHVDARDPDTGAWWEAVIVEILQCTLDQNSNEVSTKTATRDEERFFFSSLGRQSEVEGLQDDGFVYEVLFQRYAWDEDLYQLKMKDLRYRARDIVPFEDVEEGMHVMVNYNVDEAKERGYWYDCVVTHKRNTRTCKEMQGTIFIGNDAAPLEQCHILFIHEVYKVPQNIVELSRRTCDLQDQMHENDHLPGKREVRPECTRCNDHPRRRCKYCSCTVCGGKDRPNMQILCDECDQAYHLWCLRPPLQEMPAEDEWYCPDCKNDASEVVRAGEKLKESKKKAKMASKVNGCTRDWGKGMACLGRTKECTIVPPDHFGSIPGVEVGMMWRFRLQVSEAGIHRPHVAGIHGRENVGAFSIVLAGGYEDDLDKGEEFFYTGSGGRDLSGNKRTAEQSSNQTLTRMNRALAMNCAAPLNTKAGAEAKNWREGKPVRVVRSYKGRKHSQYSPEEGMRYDGIYKVVKYWPEKGKSGFIVWRYLLRRDDPTPAPWTKAGKKFIKQMGFTMQYPEGYLEAQELKSPAKRKKSEGPNPSPKRSKSTLSDEAKNLIKKDNKNAKMWKECLQALDSGRVEFLKKVEELFLCICCQEVVYRPVTTQCSHNFCKPCLQRSFKAEVFCCPMCRCQLGKDYELTVNEALAAALRHLFPGYDAGR